MGLSASWGYTTHEFDKVHQQFLALYNATAHQGLLKEGFASPIPLHVLGESKGRLVPPRVIQFSNVIPMRVNARAGWAAKRRHAAAMLE